VQQVLNVAGQWNEAHTQTFFQHILSSVISIIDEGSNDPCRDLDVTGMTEFEMMVEVCKDYLNSLNKAGTPVSSSSSCRPTSPFALFVKGRLDLPTEANFVDLIRINPAST
jgi:hypothetical protein